MIETILIYVLSGMLTALGSFTAGWLFAYWYYSSNVKKGHIPYISPDGTLQWREKDGPQ